MTLALAHEDVTMWWIAIGMGFVVVLVVITLLSLVISIVTDIDRNVKSLWNTATRVARNTATTWMLKQTVTATGALRDETALHAQAMTSLAGAVAHSGPLPTGPGPGWTPPRARRKYT